MRSLNVAFLGLLLAACSRAGGASSSDGGGATSAAPSPAAAVAPGGAIRACSLVTAAEATTALGATATNDDAKATGASSRCAYDSSAGGLIVFLTDPGKAAYDKGHAGAAAKGAGAFSELSGIGEGAFATYGGPVTSVMFHKGAYAVTIILTLQGTAKPSLEKATALAKAASSRI